VSVAAALVLLLTGTTLLTHAWRAARVSRAQARYREGVARAAEGRNAEAAEAFREALAYSHDEPVYRFALAQSLVALKRYNEAENYLYDLRVADPTNGPVNLMLARIAAAAGRDEEAIDYYHRAIFGYWPENVEQSRTKARLELIGIFDREGKPKQALAELLQLAAEAPETDVAARLQAASMLLAHGSPEHAADVYRGILASHPRDAEAQQGLGEAYLAMGDFAAGRHAFYAAVRFGSITPALAERIAFINSILDLDPTLLRLTARQRFVRAHELLSRTVTAAKPCAAAPQELIARAEAALAEQEKGMRSGETADMLTLAQSLWKARMAECPRLPVIDKPLAVLMNRMLNQ
jgi:tetratricopeptide (TPR) repeat protein